MPVNPCACGPWPADPWTGFGLGPWARGPVGQKSNSRGPLKRAPENGPCEALLRAHQIQFEELVQFLFFTRPSQAQGPSRGQLKSNLKGFDETSLKTR